MGEGRGEGGCCRLHWMRRWAFALVAAGLLLGFAASGWAQLPEQLLKSFGNVSQSGSNPTGLLVGADGNLYGITRAGGLYNSGTVFRMNPDSYSYDVLRAFGTNITDAQTPVTLLQARDGLLYGMTSGGGDNGQGVVFRMATDGSGYTNLHSFGTVLNDAYIPEALIQGADGLLYGVAQTGGSNYYGAAFKLTTNGSAYQVFYSFGNDFVSTSSSSFYADGTSPVAIMQGTDGALYGVTQQDGSNAVGVVYKLSTNGSTFGSRFMISARPPTTRKRRSAWPRGPMDFFLAWLAAAPNQMGAIFTLNTNGLVYSVYPFLHRHHGRRSDAGLRNDSRPGRCLVWHHLVRGRRPARRNRVPHERRRHRIRGDPALRHHHVAFLRHLQHRSGRNRAPLQGANGMLYGATIYGGTTGEGASLGSGAGTLFTLATNASSYAVIFNFSSSGGDGQMPVGALWPGADGWFYGVTESGGPGGQGSVFRINSSGGYQIIYGFGLDPIDGYIPMGGVRQGPDGMLYGTTAEGGYGGGNGFGTVFKLSPDGSQFTQVVSFGFWSPSGQTPTSPPWPGRDGYLYGTTSDGGYLSGYGGYGIIYKVGTNGLNYSVLHQFSTNDVEGRTPFGGLVQGSDGTLYGTAYGGESYTGTRKVEGTVFKILTNGLGFQVIHTFTNSPGDGSGPHAGAILGADGFLYGTTQFGGTNSQGTVYKLSVSGSTCQVLYSFGSVANDGFDPTAGVVQGGDGFLSGTTPYGGGAGYGVAYRLSTNGTGYTVLYNFAASPGDGQVPAGELVQGSDGGFFGMTTSGGLANFGTVFRLGQPPFEFTALSRLPNQTVFMSLSGSSNTTCRIDVSTNFVNWVTLTNLQNSNGAVQFMDSTAPGHPRRFYRAYQSAP